MILYRVIAGLCAIVHVQRASNLRLVNFVCYAHEDVTGTHGTRRFATSVAAYYFRVMLMRLLERGRDLTMPGMKQRPTRSMLTALVITFFSSSHMTRPKLAAMWRGCVLMRKSTGS